MPLTLTNTGTLAWTTGGAGRYDPLGDWVTYHLRNNATNAIEPDVGLHFIPRSVAPGESITMDVDVEGPAQPGSYTLQWDMVHLGDHFSAMGVPTGDVPLESIRTVACLADVITKIHGMIIDGPDTVYPGGVHIFTGADLGSRPGKAALLGNFPGGPVELAVLVWWDAGIAVGVPDICGVLDHEATLEVTLASGERTQYPVFFRARREVRNLVQDDMQVDCSQAAERNRCNAQGEGPLGNLPVDLAWWTHYAATGQHQCGWDSAEGVDSFSVTLINGWRAYSWVLAGSTCDKSAGSCDEAYVGPLTGFTWGSSAATLSVPWGCRGQSRTPETWLCGVFVPFPIKLACLDQGIHYLVQLNIKGPCGTTYR